MKRLALWVFLFCPLEAALAQGPATPVVTGSPSVTAGGAPVARKGDTTATGSPVTGGSTNVFINGRPAATVGSTTDCGSSITTGARNVFINGKPMATAGSSTTPCPAK
jgi:uncharacterized Zn-binding protein involved in type VI secretion